MLETAQKRATGMAQAITNCMKFNKELDPAPGKGQLWMYVQIGE